MRDTGSHLPATTRLGPVHLTVSALDRAVGWYQDAVGLRLHDRSDDGACAALGAGEEDLVVLHEDPLAGRAGRHAGLFHVALLFPTREELSRAATRLIRHRVPLEGASDHGVSEALYLRDPDGNGVELYADRPREQWPPPERDGETVGMYTRPLDGEGLRRVTADAEPPPRAGAGLRVGHVHFHVGELPRAIAFYRDGLGFDLTTTYPGAAFLAAGGYHHHVAVNVWAGENVPPVPEHVAGLRRWTVLVDDAAAVDAAADRLHAAGIDVARAAGGLRSRDPWGIAVEVRPAARSLS